MLVAGLGARHGEALMPPCGPTAHHGVGDFRVELDAVGRRPVAECLHLEDVTLSEQLGAGWQAEAFPMPLVDDLRPGLHQG